MINLEEIKKKFSEDEKLIVLIYSDNLLSIFINRNNILGSYHSNVILGSSNIFVEENCISRSEISFPKTSLELKELIISEVENTKNNIPRLFERVLNRLEERKLRI